MKGDRIDTIIWFGTNQPAQIKENNVSKSHQNNNKLVQVAK